MHNNKPTIQGTWNLDFDISKLSITEEKLELMKIFEMIIDNHDIDKLLDTATAESILSTIEEILQV